MKDFFVLGIHGNYFRTSLFHDSSATLIKNGKVIAAISEERITRQKGERNFPENSIQQVLGEGGITIEQVDKVAISGLHPTQNSYKYLKSALSTFIDTGVLLKKDIKNFSWFWLYNKLKTPSQVEFEIEGEKSGQIIEFYDHHRCHAASAFYSSPFEKALIITVDGGGDGNDGSVYLGEGNKLEKYVEIPHYQSPGTMYSGITNDLGFRRLRHEGKITGLAAFGKKKAKDLNMEGLVKYNAKKKRFISKKIARHHKDLGEKSPYFSSMLEAGESKEDLAGITQELFETSILDFISTTINDLKKEGREFDKVCLAGGCFTNVKLNQGVLELNTVDNVYVCPAMGDDGLSLGAAYLSNFRHNPNDKRQVLNNVYLGQTWNENDIIDAIKEKDLEFKKSGEIEEEVGKLLAESKVVARCNGRMEFGPRALGNRSILAAPFDKTINDWLNEQLKRTEFMPFAPSIIEEQAAEYFIGWKKEHFTSQFMTITYDVIEEKQAGIAAVVHVDGTARPQVVTKESNLSYHKIISSFFKHSNCPLVLNTSFNMHEEPIVNSPKDAVRGFILSNIEYLAIGDYLVWRK